MGRKNLYETLVQPRLNEIPEMVGVMTEEQIAKRLGISRRSLEKYKQQHEELRAALLKGFRGPDEETKEWFVKAIGRKGEEK